MLAYDTAGNLGQQSATVSATAPAAAADTTAPSAPPSLTATKSGSSAILRWAASSDNVGVAGYRVTRNGVQIADTAALTYTDTAFKTYRPSGKVTYTVTAYDAAGNVSVPSTIRVS